MGVIDALRGFSAAAVALFHFNEGIPAAGDLFHRAIKWGWLGVPVFFVVSGYCVAAAREKAGPLAFWFRRLARIYPPYWGSLLLVAVAIGLRFALIGNNDVAVLPRGAGDWLYTLAALTTPASHVTPLNWVYWSLGYELAFYVIVGLLLWPGIEWAVVLFTAAAFFAPGYPFDQWGLFALGVACRALVRGRTALGATLAIAGLASMYSRLGHASPVVGTVTAALILLPPPLVLGTVFRPLRELGAFSYSLYLIHVPLGCHVLRHLFPPLPRTFWPAILQDALLLLGCVGFAYVFHRLIEKPAHDWARNRSFGSPSPVRIASPASVPASR